MADLHIAPERLTGALPRPAGSARPAALGSLLTAVFVRVQAVRLDRALRAGADAPADPLLRCRARQLTTRRARTRLASALEGHLAEARRPAARGWGPAVPLCRVEVLRAAPQLRALADRLRGEGDVRAEGITRLRWLLTDGHGPLYQHSPPGTLARAVAAAAAALCDEC